jgi:apolipoprotein N-acyltransferase
MIVYPFLSVLLLYLSFPNFFHSFGFWPLAWIFAIPLFFALEGQSLLRRLLVGVLFGFVFYAFLVQWLIAYSFIGYVVFVFVLALQPILFAIFYQTSGQRRDVFYIAALWTATEYARTLFLHGFSWTLGHSQTFNLYPLQLANLFGSWAISFVLIAVNYALYRSLRNEDRKSHLAIAAIIVFSVSSYGFISIHSQKKDRGTTFDVCAVQSNIDSQEKRQLERIPHHIAEQIALSKPCFAKKKPDLIIWPETAIAADFREDAAMKNQLLKFVRSAGVPLLVGTALWKGDYNLNSAVLLQPNGRISAIYNKRYLVPFSEYTPAGGLWPAIGQFLHLKDFHFIAGDRSPLFSVSKLNLLESPRPMKYKFGLGICSEDTVGSFFREFSNKGAEFAVVLLNDGWFRQNAALVMHGQNAIMRAAENHLPIVRVANTGWTALINKNGEVRSRKEPWFNTKAVVTYKIIPYTGAPTLFTRIGDVFAVFCCLFVIILWSIKLVARLQNAKS